MSGCAPRLASRIFQGYEVVLKHRLSLYHWRVKYLCMPPPATGSRRTISLLTPFASFFPLGKNPAYPVFESKSV